MDEPAREDKSAEYSSLGDVFVSYGREPLIRTFYERVR